MVFRFLLGLLIHQIMNLSMCNRNTECYQRVIYWINKCCILLRNTIFYTPSWRSQHFTYIKQPKFPTKFSGTIFVPSMVPPSWGDYCVFAQYPHSVEGGCASIRDVTTMELEDHQHSFFLAETSSTTYCKLLAREASGGLYLQ